MAITSRFGRPQTAKPRNDVYIGLLVVALVAMIASCVLLLVEKSSMAGPPPTKVVPAQARFTGFDTEKGK
ncbi:MAG TPA: hypothetical protein VKS79_17480 [Gemmataceae bacterium]|nr:hypothetical protein [Gemmataceae bacterium]